MDLKQRIHQHYFQAIQANINRLHAVLADLKETAANETKSTAGDKHETALAMLQLEQEKVRNQLAEVMHRLEAMNKLQPATMHTKVAPGSLVKTDKGLLYVSIAAGKAVVDGYTVIALSPQSPLGVQLLNLKAGQTAHINQMNYNIESVE